MSFLQQEIAEQPEVISRLLHQEAETVRKIVSAIREFNPTFVSIAARGTSDNAARYAQYLLGIHARLAVALATPSIHTLYGSAPNFSRALVIGISQSGEAPDVAQVVHDARAQGALTVCITNYPDSLMAQAAHFHLALRAGEEQSVAATKTYTAELTTIAMLVSELTGSPELREGLSHIPALARQTVAYSQSVMDWVERYRYIDQFVGIGRGYNYCTAIEVSLKVQELCTVPAHGYSEADFLHGPVAVVQPGFPVMVVAPTGKASPPIREFLARVRDRRAESLVISDDVQVLGGATKGMRLPANLPEWLSPIAAVIPGQVFAMGLAAAKGNPLDKPIGLTKVTRTR